MSWERDKYFFSHVPSVLPYLSASGKETNIYGAADFGEAAGRGHGFHTRPISNNVIF